MTRIVFDKSGVINSISEDDDTACVATLQNVSDPTEQDKEAWANLQAEIIREFKAGAIIGENWGANGAWIDVDFMGNKRTFRIPEDAISEQHKNKQIKKIENEIQLGATSGNNWNIVGRQVEVDGEFKFPLQVDIPRINDDRIAKYLHAHNVHLGQQEIRKLRAQLSSLSDVDAKNKLKQIIIEWKRGHSFNF